jgi:hypothetical protein
MAQWRMAFAIAAENERQGHKPMPTIQFIRHWKAAAKRQQRVRESMGTQVTGNTARECKPEADVPERANTVSANG